MPKPIFQEFPVNDQPATSTPVSNVWSEESSHLPQLLALKNEVEMLVGECRKRLNQGVVDLSVIDERISAAKALSEQSDDAEEVAGCGRLITELTVEASKIRTVNGAEARFMKTLEARFTPAMEQDLQRLRSIDRLRQKAGKLPPKPMSNEFAPGGSIRY